MFTGAILDDKRYLVTFPVPGSVTIEPAGEPEVI